MKRKSYVVISAYVMLYFLLSSLPKKVFMLVFFFLENTVKKNRWDFYANQGKNKKIQKPVESWDLFG